MAKYSEREKREIREDLIAALEATHPNPNTPRKTTTTKRGTHNG